VKAAFIPMGPACLAAGILKAGNLRCCSYPLDWGQSGSTILEDLFILKPNDCYYRHFHQPNRSYYQPGIGKKNTCESPYHNLGELIPIYGFPYFYNPHKPLGQSREYFIRCLQRFQKVVFDDSIIKVFLYAERLDTPAERYFPDDGSHLEFIDGVLRSYVCGDWQCILVSIAASTPYQFFDTPYTLSHFRSLTRLVVNYPSSMPLESYHPYVLASLRRVIGNKMNPVDSDGRASSRAVSGSPLLSSFRPWI